MASRSLCSAGVLAKCFSISQTRCILDTKPFFRVLVPTHYQQQRGVRKRPPEPFARKRRARIQDSGLSPANESFLQEVIANEARSKVEELAKMNCPLKDGPWARGEWRKG
ncbi:uncharacterized protein LOC106177988 [Lingula anatina]|uniref:Uncharacterized protein LOC106177988 n=1 Tax=Lingula anatina TaxID=7574 RepID=A0A1S3K2A8_LINAN|nr:uncharacterized protein LOC106177988 [Lingula anatina]|eukprot:XP_013416406.1 uncharacterized protein LOC106177988 [Lingula anatina]